MSIGLDIRGLDMTEISHQMERYVADYFKGFSLPVGASLFQESYLLDYDECVDMIPTQHRQHFRETDKFNGASGFLEGIGTFDDSTPILMLLTNDDNSKALFLFVREPAKQHDILLADFLT